MNIHFQICGLILSLFLLVLYQTHTTLGLKGEQVFVRMLHFVILCLSLDAISVIAIHFKDVLPEVLVRLICKAYLMSMTWVGWVSFCYVILDLASSDKQHATLSKHTAILTAIENVIILCLPITIRFDGSDAFTEGPAVMCTYVFVLIFILATLSAAVSLIRGKNSRRGLAAVMTTSCWIIAAIIQAINNELLIVGFSMAVGVMILYIVMENPDSNLDRQFGCFNSYALNSYLKWKLSQGEEFHVLDFSVTDIKALEDRGLDVTDIARKISYAMESIKDVMVFKGFNTGFVAISKDENRLEDTINTILSKTAIYRDAQDSVLMFVIEHAERFESSNDILKFSTYVRSRKDLRLSVIVHVSDKLIEDYKKNEQIEKEIDSALEEDRVEVFYQPIWHYADQTVVSAEALVRIRNRDGSMMSPGIFIPTAESTGQIGILGERVLAKVCEFIKHSDVLQYGIKNIHVNLSAVQCDDSSMAGTLSQIVESHGVNPKNISFEITETAVSQAQDVLIENMNALISKGFTFSLDDFGKGESNLMYIVEMPVDEIKLDMDMSKAYFNNPKAKHVVMAVSDMAKRLDLSIVAEGIESPEELEGITKENINLIQGFYYSRPLPGDEFIEYLKNNVTKVAGTISYSPSTTAESSADSYDFDKHTVKNILLVEDNEMNREIAQDILEDCGFNVDTAEDGTIAVEKYCSVPSGTYDMILMDIRMPMMDGYEATRRIREYEQSQSYKKGIYIVALTSQDSEEDRRLTFESGMNEHVVKPLDTKKLQKIIESLS